MKDNKKDSIKKVEDFNFIPLNIKDPLKFNDNNLLPFDTEEELSKSNSANYIFIGFPPLNPGFTELPKLNFTPSKGPQMQYPSNVPDIEKSTPTQNYIDLEYPSEVDEESLYSYNKQRNISDYCNDLVTPMDILRSVQLFDDEPTNSLDRNNKLTTEIEDIFEKIQQENASLFATLKAFKMPYPIAKLFIKKIIRLTLSFKR